MNKESKKKYLLCIPERLHAKLKEKSEKAGLSMRYIVQRGLEKELKHKSRW